jgi:hypothetical protein
LDAFHPFKNILLLFSQVKKTGEICVINELGVAEGEVFKNLGGEDRDFPILSVEPGQEEFKKLLVIVQTSENF